MACCGVNNRGVALWKDKIISISLDGRLFSLNKATGEMVWERKVADPAVAETLTLAPLVVRDIAIVGVAGGEFGVRGWIDGTDLNTGKQVWRTYTIPGAGRAGARDLEGRQGTLQARRRLGLGDRDLRCRDRHLLPGHRQCRPRLGSGISAGRQQMGRERARAQPERRQDQVGLSSTRRTTPTTSTKSPSTRSSTPRSTAQDRKLVVHAARNGFYYALDRTNGSFVLGKQYVDQLNWTTGLDPKTGRPLNYNPNTDVQEYAPRSHSSRANPKSDRLCPSHYGGKNWEPGAYNPELNLLYIPSIEGCNTVETVEQKDFEDQGGPVKSRERFAGGAGRPTERLYGSIKALDPTTGETKVRTEARISELRGALATAGNLVFLGHYDGTFSAYDAKTLQELWSFNTGTGINAPAVTYCGQRQAVHRGPGGIAQPAERLGQRARAQAHRDRVHALRVRAITSRTAIRAGATSRRRSQS